MSKQNRTAAKVPVPVSQVSLKPDELHRQLLPGDPTDLITALEQARGSRVLCLVYNDLVPGGSLLTFSTIPPFEAALRDIGHVPKLDVFLRCPGGQAEIPWRLVSLLREYTDDLGIVISKYAMSGACHIALAGDELLMTPFSALGSVDPTRNHPLLPKDANGNPIPTSVQDLKHCVEFISAQLGDNNKSEDLAGIISELFKYIDPLALGALEQSYNLSRLITKKVLKTRRVALRDEVIEKIIELLSGKYFSHSFLISRTDVEQDLELPVIKPDENLTNLIEKLGNFFDSQFLAPKAIGPPNQGLIIHAGAFISTNRIGFVEAKLIGKNSKIEYIGWQKYI